MTEARPPSLEHALRDSDVLYDRATLERSIADLAARLDADLAGERALFLTVMQGGLIFAAQLALCLRTDVEFDYVHATRYRGQTRGQTLEWLCRPRADMRGRTVLLVDDILDEGHTLDEVRKACLEQGARRVWLVTLCTKRHERRSDGIEADYNGVDVPDRYVFGYGMDYYEQGRNIPAIHALRSAH